MRYNSITDVPNNILKYWNVILEGNQSTNPIDQNDIVMAENAIKQWGNPINSHYTMEGFTMSQIVTEYNKRMQEIGIPLTTKQQVEFIASHDIENIKYDIEKLFKQSFDKALTDMLPCVYFRDGKANIFTRSFQVNYNKSLQDNADKFEAIITDLKIPMADFIPYCSHMYLFSDYFRREDNKRDQFKGSNVDTSRLIHFCEYLVMPTLKDNYEDTHKLMDASGIKYNTGTWELTIGNLKIKRYLNGRIDIKGLTDKQQNIIDTMLGIYEKVRNK